MQKGYLNYDFCVVLFEHLKMCNYKIKPEYVVNIQKMPSLDYIKGGGKDGLKIGALTSIRSVELSTAAQNDHVIIYKATNQLTSVQAETMGIWWEISTGVPGISR